MSKSNTTLVLVGLIFIIFIGGGYYFLCSQAAKNIQVVVSSYDCDYDDNYKVDVDIQIRNTVKIAVILSEQSIRLYILASDFGKKEFEDDWIKLDGGETETFSGTWILLSSTESEILNKFEPASSDEHNIIVFYKAKVKSGIYTGYIETNYHTSFNRKLTKNELQQLGY